MDDHFTKMLAQLKLLCFQYVVSVLKQQNQAKAFLTANSTPKTRCHKYGSITLRDIIFFEDSLRHLQITLLFPLASTVAHIRQNWH